MPENEGLIKESKEAIKNALREKKLYDMEKQTVKELINLDLLEGKDLTVLRDIVNKFENMLKYFSNPRIWDKVDVGALSELSRKLRTLENESIDIIISLFTLLHIDQINIFFEEVYRILKNEGIFILFHHIERRNYVYKEGKNEYKIHSNKWSYKQIEDLLEYNFFNFKVYPIEEN